MINKYQFTIIINIKTMQKFDWKGLLVKVLVAAVSSVATWLGLTI